MEAELASKTSDALELESKLAAAISSQQSHVDEAAQLTSQLADSRKSNDELNAELATLKSAHTQLATVNSEVSIYIICYYL